METPQNNIDFHAPSETMVTASRGVKQRYTSPTSPSSLQIWRCKRLFHRKAFLVQYRNLPSFYVVCNFCTEISSAFLSKKVGVTLYTYTDRQALQKRNYMLKVYDLSTFVHLRNPALNFLNFLSNRVLLSYKPLFYRKTSIPSPSCVKYWL